MDRFFVRTASVVVCAVWAASCGGPAADDVAPPPPADKVAAGDKPETLGGEIANAHTLRVSGDYAEAAKSFGQLMLVAPDDPQIVSEYGKTLVQQDRPADAMPFLKRSLELQANDWTVYSAIGVAYDQLDDHAHARLAYEHALSLKPGAPQILNNFAVSRMMAGDLEGARRLFAQASPSSDPKIAANLAVLASMRKPVAAAGVAPASAPVAHPAAQHTAAAKPQYGHAGASKPADGPPRVLAGVMMERVPVDLHAGPWHRKSGTAQSDLHRTRIAAAQLAANSKEPMLRTADDGE
jgi:Flp pilus assembly protein TadD